MDQSSMESIIVRARDGQLSEVEFAQVLLQIITEKSGLEKKIEEDSHKVDFYEAVAGSDQLIEMSMVAKIVNIPGYGRNNIFELLRNKKILRYNNEPYQEYVDRGYFKPIEQRVTLPYGETKINIKTMVTQKGIEYIRKVINEC